MNAHIQRLPNKFYAPRVIVNITAISTHLHIHVYCGVAAEGYTRHIAWPVDVRVQAHYLVRARKRINLLLATEDRVTPALTLPRVKQWCY